METDLYINTASARTCDSERMCVHLLLKATGGVFDPIKYQNLKPQNKHSHFQEVHQVGTFDKSAKYEAGQLLMSLPVHPEKNQNKNKKTNSNYQD